MTLSVLFLWLEMKEPLKMAKMCTVSRLERQFATLCLFHAPTRGGVLGGGVYTREMGTICPFGVFPPVLSSFSLQNWPFSPFKT